jgi:hypothetical protein
MYFAWRRGGAARTAPKKSAQKYNMTTTDVKHHSRFCNCFLRNLCVSIAAERGNLTATYDHYDEIMELGVPLFSGDLTHKHTVMFNDELFEKVVNNKLLVNANLNANECYFQKTATIKYLYDYLRSPRIKAGVIEKNPFREKYGESNCFIHVRLGDVVHWNPGFEYYDKVLSATGLKYDKLYISSDSPEHEICKKIIDKYGAILVNETPVKTIQLGSTCRYLILSNGSFSSVIGYLAYSAETVFYPQMKSNWHGDLFCIPGWICVRRDEYMPGRALPKN